MVPGDILDILQLYSCITSIHINYGYVITKTCHNLAVDRMSDSNPFSDPTKTERFDEKKGRVVKPDSPSSPLIPAPPKPTVITPSVPTAPKKDLDDYNPFDDAQQTEPKPADKPPRGAEGISWFGFGSKKQKYTVSGGDTSAEIPPPTYADTSTAAMRELKQREEELARREQAIREREESAGQVGPGIIYTLL